MLKSWVGLRKEAYTSYYEYDEEVKEYVERTGSISAFDGTVYLSRILLDIDSGILAARRVFERLVNDFAVPSNSLRVYASGNGFHLLFPDIFGFTPSPELPAQVKLTLKRYFPEADAIYDKTRIVRAPNSWNPTARAYKVLLTQTEFFAPDVNLPEVTSNVRIGVLDPLRPLPQQRDKIVYEEPAKVLERVSQPLTPDVTCMQKAFNMGPVDGEKHNTIMRMVSSWRRKAIPLEVARSMALSWVQGALGEGEVTRLVQNVYSKPYVYGCHDPVMARWCDPLCKYFKTKDYAPVVATADQMEADYIEYAKIPPLFDLRRIFPSLPSYHFYRGEFDIFYGDTKLGKTAFVQNMVLPLTDIPIDFYSLETQQQLMFRRFMQIAHHMSKHEIAQHYLSGGKSLTAPIRHINIIPPTTQTRLAALKTMLRERRPGIAVIDTIDCIQIDNGKEWNVKSEILAYELMNISHATDVVIIGINHIPKAAGKDMWGRPKRLDIHSQKGSSSLEQKADKAISIERIVGGDPSHRLITSQGARDEEPFEAEFEMDMRTFTYSIIPPNRGAYGSQRTTRPPEQPRGLRDGHLSIFGA